MLRSLLFVVLLCSTTLLHAQSPFFSMHYIEFGETADETTHITTQDGGNLIASVQHISLSTNYCIVICKTDGTGSIQWVKRIATDRPGLRNVVQSADGTYFLCYCEFPFGNYYEAMRLDQNGNVLFDKRINLPALHHVTWKTSAVAKMDSGYYVSCSIFDTATSMYKWNLVEISASGNVVWTKNYNAGGFLGSLNGMELCTNGDVLLLGSEYDIPTQAYVGMATRIAPNGNLLWNTRFGYAGHDVMPADAERQGNDFIVAVQDYQQSAGLAAIDFMKIDAAGSIAWTMRYTNTNPNSSLLPYDIIVSGGGSYVAVAQRSGPQPGSVFLQVDGSGQYVSSRFYPDYTIASIENYGQWMYSLTGTKDSFNYHYTALKTVDGNGIGCNDTTAVFGVGPVTLTSATGGTAANFSLTAVNGPLLPLTASFVPHIDCNLTGMNDDAEIQSNISIYPVPANEQLFISSASEITMIEILDVNGATVRTQTVNASSCVAETAGLPGGIYFVRVTSESGTKTLRASIAR